MHRLFYFLRYEFSHRFDPYKDYFKQATRSALAGLLAIVVFRLLPQFGQAYWIILTAVYIIQTRLGNTSTQQLISVAASSLVVTATASVAVISAQSPFSLAAYISLFGIALAFASFIGQNMIVRVFFITILTIISGGLSLNDDSIWQRSLMILIGGLCALGCSFLWLQKPIDRFEKVSSIYVHSVVEFLCLVSYLAIKGIDFEKFESQTQERKDRLFLQLKHLRDLSKKLNSEENIERVKAAESLWLLSIGFSNLHSLFSEDLQKARDIFCYAQQQLTPIFRGFISEKYLHLISVKSVRLPDHVQLIDFYVERLDVALKEELQE